MMPGWDAEGDGEIVGGPYRQLSAMAHGTSYAVLMVSDIDRDGDTPRGASRLRAALSVERASEIVAPAMIAYEMSVGAWLNAVRAEVPMWTEAVSQACELVDELRPT